MRRREDFTDAYGRSEKPELDTYDGFSRLQRKSYERYFDGYTVEKFTGPNGKATKYRVYTGDLFRPELNGSAHHRRTLTYGLCLCTALILSIAALMLPTPSNSNVIVFFFACISIALYIRMLFAFSAYAGAGAELKIYEYRSGAKAIERFARPALISATAAVAVTVAVMIIRKSSFTLTEFARILMLTLSGLLAEVVGRMEKQVKYELIPGDKDT